MVIVGRIGTESFKYCALSSNIFFLPNGSGMGNVSGIYVVLMNKASYYGDGGRLLLGMIIVERLNKTSTT